MVESLRIDIRDRRLPTGRLNVSAGTSNRKLRDQREAAVRALIDNGDMETIELLRARKLHISEIQVAVRKGTVEDLKPREHHTAQLGPRVDALLKTVLATREPGTYRVYSVACRALIEKFGRDALLRRITLEQAEEFLHEPKSRGTPWAATNQQQVATVAARIWRSAGIPEKSNPWKLAERPRKRTKRQAFLQPSEWRALHGHIAGTSVAAVLALGCLAGLREGEVANLRTDIDVDLVARVIRIQPRTGEYAWRPKTDNSVRTVPMSNELHAILTEHVRRGLHGDRYFVHLPKQDRPLTPKTIIRWTRLAFEKAGIRYGLKGDGLTNHSLRHTFATWLLLAKVPVHVVAKLMGDTVEVVMRTYAHLLVADLNAAVATLDDVLAGVT